MKRNDTIREGGACHHRRAHEFREHDLVGSGKLMWCMLRTMLGMILPEKSDNNRIDHGSGPDYRPGLPIHAMFGL